MSTRKGKKGQKNIPMYYEEVKERHTVVLTPTAWKIRNCSPQQRCGIANDVSDRYARQL